MKDYHIFLIATENFQNLLRLLFLSMKKWKKEQSRYIIHLYLDSNRIDYYNQKFKNLTNDNFIIQITSSILYKNLLDQNIISKYPYVIYTKLLIPRLFPNLDKILVLDCDLLIKNSGLEDFMDENIDDYYINAILEPHITFCSKDWKQGYEERKQCKTKNYFNGGVYQLNLKKIREDKKDIQMFQVAIKWPEPIKNYWLEQTLLNYILRDKVKISDPKFDNCSLLMFNLAINDMKEYIKKWNYNSFEDLLDKTVILHFAGPKPWKDGEFQDFPLFNIAKQQYEKIKKELE